MDSLTGEPIAEEDDRAGEEEVTIYFCVEYATKLSFYTIHTSETEGLVDGGGEHARPVFTHEGHQIGPRYAIVGSTIYVCAGRCDSPYVACRHVHLIDTEKPGEGWKEGPPLNEARVSPLVFSAKGKIFVVGGHTLGSRKPPGTEVFDPASGKWEWVQINDCRLVPGRVLSHAVDHGGDHAFLWLRPGMELYSYTVENGDCVRCEVHLGNPFALAVLGNVLYTAGFRGAEFILTGYVNSGGPIQVNFIAEEGEYLVPCPGVYNPSNCYVYPIVRLFAIGGNELVLIWWNVEFLTHVYSLRMKIKSKVHSGKIIQLDAELGMCTSQTVLGRVTEFFPICRGSKRQQQDSNSDVVKEVQEQSSSRKSRDNKGWTASTRKFGPNKKANSDVVKEVQEQNSSRKCRDNKGWAASTLKFGPNKKANSDVVKEVQEQSSSRKSRDNKGWAASTLKFGPNKKDGNNGIEVEH